MIRLAGWIVFFVCSPALAVPAVVFDQNGNVTGYGDVRSTQDAPTNSIVIDSPNDSKSDAKNQMDSSNLSVFNDFRMRNIPVRYWKVENGLLREMSQTEKNAVDAPVLQEQARIAALSSERDSLELDVDTSVSSWSDLSATQKTEALRKSMRLNRVYRLLGDR